MIVHLRSFWGSLVGMLVATLQTMLTKLVLGRSSMVEFVPQGQLCCDDWRLHVDWVKICLLWIILATF